MADAPHRAGVVALLGPPNAGKSTLLNRLVGEKLAIVTSKPQTTRSRILGIRSEANAQVLFYDTPGLHKGKGLLSEVMNEAIEEVAHDCDVALLLVDACAGWRDVHSHLARELTRHRANTLVIGTKCDRPNADPKRWPPSEAGDLPNLRVSAQTGDGVDTLWSQLVERLPESPPLFPDDQLTDRPLRFLCAELVREAAFRILDQELPYDLAVEVDTFDESRADLVRIRGKLLVRRDSQKGIVVGSGGLRIKQIGVEARREIEKLLDQHVHLELRVKVESRWDRQRNRLKSFGYF